tara:strand:+ start:355 stop:534 length:180 start_codon:yes stop_codon:yes gene_type:complete
MSYPKNMISNKIKKVMLMFKSKKAFIMHPGVWIGVAFVAGLLIMYLLAKGIIPVGIKIC